VVKKVVQNGHFLDNFQKRSKLEFLSKNHGEITQNISNHISFKNTNKLLKNHGYAHCSFSQFFAKNEQKRSKKRASNILEK